MSSIVNESKEIEESIWQKLEKKIRLFQFFNILLSIIMIMMFGTWYLIMFFFGRNSIISNIFLVNVLCWAIFSLLIALVSQKQVTSSIIINRIKYGLKIEQLIMIANNTFVNSKPITKIQRKLAIAALAEIGAEQAIEMLNEIKITDQKDVREISSKAILEIERRHEINIHTSNMEAYKDNQGEFISLFERERNEIRKNFPINVIPMILIGLIVSIVGIITFIYSESINYNSIFFIVFGIIIAIVMVIVIFAILKDIDKLMLLVEEGELDKLIDIAKKGNSLMFDSGMVVCAIAILGDIGNEDAIPVLSSLFGAHQKIIRQKAAIAIDMIYVKNNNPMRKFIEL